MVWDQKVPGSSSGYARSMLNPWERLLTCIPSPHSYVKRVPDYRQYARVTCHYDSFSVMLPRELRKVQWFKKPVGAPCKVLRALFVDKRYTNALFNLI